jgi:hypothetical protein
MVTGFIFGILTPEDGTDILPRNVAMKLQLLYVTAYKRVVLICFAAEA